jgi:hypothetical protein
MFGIGRFETIRRVLQHEATLTAEGLAAVATAAGDRHRPADEKAARAALTEYAAALVARRDELHDDELPDGVLPSVDVTNLRVVHTTCTGRTKIELEHGRIAVIRKEHLDPTSPRDVALWLLSDGVRWADPKATGSVFAWPESGRPRRVATERSDAERLSRSPLVIIEAIASMIRAGATLEWACSRAQAWRVPADANQVREEISSRRIGLWLSGRTSCQAAWRALTEEEGMPEWAYLAADAIREATRRTRWEAAPSPQLAPDPIADWERELATE